MEGVNLILEAVNLIKMYYKHICKFHNVAPPTTIIYANKNLKCLFVC
jgi:hypothetical protein